MKAETVSDGNTNLHCSYALKWLVHFLGDITQPLHASGIAAGGNLINVIFGNRSTELHAVWDGDILYADAGVTSFPNSTLHPFFAGIVSRINDDYFFEPVDDCVVCTDLSRSLQCALVWARESNDWTCQYVYSHKITETDLLTSGYAEGAYPIVELQTAKAAKRLSIWLDALVAGSYQRDRKVVQQTYLRPMGWSNLDHR